MSGGSALASALFRRALLAGGLTARALAGALPSRLAARGLFPSLLSGCHRLAPFRSGLLTCPPVDRRVRRMQLRTLHNHVARTNSMFAIVIDANIGIVVSITQ